MRWRAILVYMRNHAPSSSFTIAVQQITGTIHILKVYRAIYQSKNRLNRARSVNNYLPTWCKTREDLPIVQSLSRVNSMIKESISSRLSHLKGFLEEWGQIKCSLRALGTLMSRHLSMIWVTYTIQNQDEVLCHSTMIRKHPHPIEAITFNMTRNTMALYSLRYNQRVTIKTYRGSQRCFLDLSLLPTFTIKSRRLL